MDATFYILITSQEGETYIIDQGCLTLAERRHHFMREAVDSPYFTCTTLMYHNGFEWIEFRKLKKNFIVSTKMSYYLRSANKLGILVSYRGEEV